MMLDFKDISKEEDERETNPFSESDSRDSSDSDADTNSAHNNSDRESDERLPR